MGHFERCITLWMYALDMQQKMLEPLSPMTQSSLLSFAELFSYMMSEGRNRNNNQRRSPPIGGLNLNNNDVQAGEEPPDAAERAQNNLAILVWLFLGLINWVSILTGLSQPTRSRSQN